MRVAIPPTTKAIASVAISELMRRIVDDEAVDDADDDARPDAEQDRDRRARVLPRNARP